MVGDDDDDDEDEVEEDDEPYATFIITLPPGYPRERRVLPEVIAVEGSKSISPKLSRALVLGAEEMVVFREVGRSIDGLYKDSDRGRV